MTWHREIYTKTENIARASHIRFSIMTLEDKVHCHRIIVYAEVKGTHKNHWVQLMVPHRTIKKSDHISESIVQILLKFQWACCYDRFPGEPVPVLNHSLAVDTSPNIQPEPSPSDSCHFLESHHCSPALPFPSWESCRLLWNFPSVRNPSDNSQPLGQVLWVFPNQMLGREGTSIERQVQGSALATGTARVGCSPCAWCWLLSGWGLGGQGKNVVFPTLCAWVSMGVL